MKSLKPDGCTASPDLWYRHCCNRHDIDYLTGEDENGNPITRATSDRRFFRCMKNAGSHLPIRGLIIPSIYYLAVRLFGAFFWRKPKAKTKNSKSPAP